MIKRSLTFLSLLLALILLAACNAAPTQEPAPEGQPTEAPTEVAADPTETAIPTPAPTAAPICAPFNPEIIDTDALNWWNEAVFYEIFVRSFYDSDGDGIGDFNGIIEKLDYLNDGDPNTTDDLGITGLWLMPINASPSYHGYDVTDYYAVNPEYGTMDDFKRLLAEADKRGIEVIIDLVLNHTSTKHPWFVDASTNPDSEYRDYYIFQDAPGGFKSPWGSDVWYQSDTGFYYGIFWSGMPDLNYTNPDVVAEMQEVVRFWLDDVGVDGFRLDAIKHIVEDGSIQENTPATHAYWQTFYDHYTGVNPNALTVGEAWTSTDEVVKYIGDEVSIAFEFDLAGAMIEAARTERSLKITQAHELILNSYPPHQYGVFLSNHDQVRIMTFYRGDIGKAKSAASLMLTGPGVPFLYYGEEIGQRGSKPDENLRTPMQWSADAYAGFTSAEMPWRSPQKDFEDANVALQTGEPDSLLSHYRRLIHARNTYPALQKGAMFQLPVANRGVYAFLRYTGEQTLLVIINLTDDPIENYRFCLSDGNFETGSAVEVLHNAPVNAPALNAAGGFDDYRPIDILDPYTTYLVEIK